MFASENGLRGDPRLKGISEAIRVVPHFPKPGNFFYKYSKEPRKQVLMLYSFLFFLARNNVSRYNDTIIKSRGI